MIIVILIIFNFNGIEEVIILEDLSPATIEDMGNGLNEREVLEIIQFLIYLQKLIFDFLKIENLNFVNQLNFLNSVYRNEVFLFMDTMYHDVYRGAFTKFYLPLGKQVLDIKDDLYNDIIDYLSFEKDKGNELTFSEIFDYLKKEENYKMPWGLIHGDLYLNNVLFSMIENENVLRGVIDYQWCGRGPLCFDSVILIYFSMNTDERKIYEKEILEDYYLKLKKLKIIEDQLTREDFEHDYNLTKIFCYFQLICSVDIFKHFFFFLNKI